jgi:hypothetical protein
VCPIGETEKALLRRHKTRFAGGHNIPKQTFLAIGRDEAGKYSQRSRLARAFKAKRSHASPKNSKDGHGTFSSRPSTEQLVVLLVARFSTEEEQQMVTEVRETGSLIGSDKVEGTAVYGANDTKIGSIERVMIDKLTGKVSYAVLSFGGFLGIGDDHYPLPWQSLKYDTNLGGYRTGITETQLKGAPKYSNDNAWNWSDPAKTRSVNDYYGVAI